MRGKGGGGRSTDGPPRSSDLICVSSVVIRAGVKLLRFVRCVECQVFAGSNGRLGLRGRLGWSLKQGSLIQHREEWWH